MALLRVGPSIRIPSMNARTRFLTCSILACSSLLFFGACGSKEDPAAPAEAAESPAADKPSGQTMGVPTAEVIAGAAAASEEARKAAERAADTARAEAEVAAAAAEKQAEAVAAKVKADAEAAAAKAEAEAKAAAAEVKAQAADLMARYSEEIDALKANATKLAGLIDKNADVLPAEVTAKYNEFKELIPEVSAMVESLKDYQGADLQNIVSKIQADTGKAAELYREIVEMIPEGLSVPSFKMP